MSLVWQLFGHKPIVPDKPAGDNGDESSANENDYNSSSGDRACL